MTVPGFAGLPYLNKSLLACALGSVGRFLKQNS